MTIFSDFNQPYGTVDASINVLKQAIRAYDISLQLVLAEISPQNDLNSNNFNFEELNSDVIMNNNINNTLQSNINVNEFDSYIQNLDASMQEINNAQENYNQLLNVYKMKVNQYNTIISQLDNSKTSVNFNLMYVWIFLLFLFGYAAFISVVEDSGLSLGVQVAVYIAFIIIGYYSLLNLYYWYINTSF